MTSITSTAGASLPPVDPKAPLVSAAAVGVAIAVRLEPAAQGASPNWAVAVLVLGAVGCAWADAWARRGSREDPR